jgi:hypothetical protein
MVTSTLIALKPFRMVVLRLLRPRIMLNYVGIDNVHNNES